MLGTNRFKEISTGGGVRMNDQTLIKMVEITKKFPGVVAIDAQDKGRYISWRRKHVLTIIKVFWKLHDG